MRIKTYRIVLIVVLTIFLLFLFLRNSDFGEVWRLIRTTHVVWFVVALLCNFGGLLFRTERWRTVLNPSDRPAFYPTFFATALGFMSSAVLPIRAGDFIRPALLSRRTGIRFSAALGTVLTERVLDLFAILTLFNVFILANLLGAPAFPPRQMLILRSAGAISLTLFLVLSTFMVLLFFSSGTVRKAHERLGRILPRRIQSGWMHFFDSFVKTLAITRNGPAFLRVILLTAGVWTCLCSQFFFVMQAMRHPLPFIASFFVTGMVILGFSIPTPGGVGGFHKVCQIVLTGFYGFDVNTSVAVALVFHVVGVAPVILTGLYLLAHEGLSVRQLARIAEESEKVAVETVVEAVEETDASQFPPAHGDETNRVGETSEE